MAFDHYRAPCSVTMFLKILNVRKYETSALAAGCDNTHESYAVLVDSRGKSKALEIAV